MHNIPAKQAAPTCTNLLSGSNTPLPLSVCLAFAYTEKYNALDGATPTNVGPRPLNKARIPSVSKICLKQDKIPTGLE